MTDINRDERIDYEFWTTDQTGSPVPQRSNPNTIHGMLDMLELEPGHQILEIGTGSGYSSALLVNAVGGKGHVTSIDVDSALVERADRLHHDSGHTAVEVLSGDGYFGWPAAAPYDRIVAWTTPDLLPHAWVNQAAHGAVIVTPVKVAPVAMAHVVLKTRIVDGQPTGGAVSPGGFVDMAPHVVIEHAVPVRHIDAARHDDKASHTWISGTQLQDNPSAAAALLRDLSIAGPALDEAEDIASFHAFLLARTDSPASAGTADGWGLGVATPSSVTILTTNGLLQAGSAETTDDLREVIDEWRRRDRPSHVDLSVGYHQVAEGWLVRLTHG